MTIAPLSSALPLVALAVLYWVGGRGVAGLLGLPRRGVEGFAWSYALGTGIASLILLAAFTCSVSRAWFSAAVAADGNPWIGVALVAAPMVALLAVGERSVRSRPSIARTESPSRWALLPGLLGALQIVSALAPETGWDALAYHLPAAWRTAAEGPGPTFGLLDGEGRLGFDLLWAPALSSWSGPPRGPAVLHAFASVALGAAIFSEATRRAGSAAAALVASLWLAAPVVADLSGTAYVDLGVGLYAFLAVAAVGRAVRGDGGRNVLAAGLLAGFAANAKLPALAWIPAAAVALVAGIGWRGGRRPAASLALTGLLTTLPWAIRAWSNTGNPVFPAMAGTFGTGWADAQIVERTTHSIVHQTGLARGPWLPVTGVLHGALDAAFSYALPIWILALAPLAVSRRLSAEGRSLAVGGCFAFGAWGLVVPQVRFGLGVFAWAAVAAAIGGARLAATWPKLRSVAIVSAIVLLAVSARDAWRAVGRLETVVRGAEARVIDDREDDDQRMTGRPRGFQADGRVTVGPWMICATAPKPCALDRLPAGVGGPQALSVDSSRNGVLRGHSAFDPTRFADTMRRRSIRSVIWEHHVDVDLWYAALDVRGGFPTVDPQGAEPDKAEGFQLPHPHQQWNWTRLDPSR